MKSVTFSLLQSAANAFDFGGPVLCDAHHYGEGHINDTFVVWREDHSKRFILQRINTDTFTNPVGLMENVCGVTRHLRAKILAEGGDPARENAECHPNFVGVDLLSGCRRRRMACLRLVEDTICLQQVRQRNRLPHRGRDTGQFQNQLEDYPASTLSTKPSPASTTRPTAMPILKKPSPPMHWAEQKISRRKSNLSMRGSRTAMSCWISWQLAKFLCASPTMDTKINNVLIDAATGKGICVIDLDTVMPGLSPTTSAIPSAPVPTTLR